VGTVADTAERRRIVARGRVQGVWYRESCRREAERLGVAGWARNLDDGSVEVVAEGEPPALDALVAWCREGPPRALVSRVDVRGEPPEGLTGFRTR
jgi:acylphosphatase